MYIAALSATAPAAAKLTSAITEDNEVTREKPPKVKALANDIDQIFANMFWLINLYKLRDIRGRNDF